MQTRQLPLRTIMDVERYFRRCLRRGLTPAAAGQRAFVYLASLSLADDNGVTLYPDPAELRLNLHTIPISAVHGIVGVLSSVIGRVMEDRR